MYGCFSRQSRGSKNKYELDVFLKSATKHSGIPGVVLTPYTIGSSFVTVQSDL
jgi:hypothetical protein